MGIHPQRHRRIANVALLLVHHLRKMKDDGDPFNMISGTNGIMGAADTTMVLTKEKRGDSNATFSVVGRDVESSDTVLRFNKDTCYWENLGDADWFAEQQARQEYQESPIVQTIKKLLEQSPEGWSGTAQQLMDAGRFIVRRPLADSTQGLSKKLQNLDRLLFENDGIVHERKRNGSGGGKHKFYSNTVPQFEELEQTEFDPFLGGVKTIVGIVAIVGHRWSNHQSINDSNDNQRNQRPTTPPYF